MMRLFLTATVASLAIATSVSAAPAGPPLLVIHQIVADYAKWRPGYDAHASARTDAGLTNCSVRTEADNPNSVFVACVMADLAKAKAFTASKGLADAMKNAGVVGKPDIWFLSAEK
jgi:hypothetical protein